MKPAQTIIKSNFTNKTSDSLSPLFEKLVYLGPIMDYLTTDYITVINVNETNHIASENKYYYIIARMSKLFLISSVITFLSCYIPFFKVFRSAYSNWYNFYSQILVR